MATGGQASRTRALVERVMACGRPVAGPANWQATVVSVRGCASLLALSCRWKNESEGEENEEETKEEEEAATERGTKSLESEA